MDLERIIHTLKGISSILVTMSEVRTGKVRWDCWGIALLNQELIKCIESLEENIPRQ